MLHPGVCPANILVGKAYGKLVEDPWPPRIGVRINKLGVCDENKSMRIRIASLAFSLAISNLKCPLKLEKHTQFSQFSH